MYAVAIGSGHGVFTVYGDKRRVRHELANLPDGWTVLVWEISNPDRPRCCDPSEFA